MIDESKLISVGKVNKTHGVRGELSVTIDDDIAYDTLDQGSWLFFDMQGIHTPFKVASARPRSAQALLIILDGVSSVEDAAEFVGKEAFMNEEDMPLADEGQEDDEDEDADGGFYAAQLIGFAAIDGDGNRKLGDIEDIDETTENVLFVVRRADGAVSYIPVVDDFISEISMNDHTVVFDLPPGLAELI